VGGVFSGKLCPLLHLPEEPSVTLSELPFEAAVCKYVRARACVSFFASAAYPRTIRGASNTHTHTHIHTHTYIHTYIRFRMCEEALVPSVVLASIECPEGLPIAGRLVCVCGCGWVCVTVCVCVCGVGVDYQFTHAHAHTRTHTHVHRVRWLSRVCVALNAGSQVCVCVCVCVFNGNPRVRI
jgi:hypothetical protein